MTKEAFLKSKWYKVLLAIVIIVMAIAIYKNGYAFGQWLYLHFNS